MIPFQGSQLNINEESNSYKVQVIKAQQLSKKKQRNTIRILISIPPFPFLCHIHRAIKLYVKDQLVYSFRALLCHMKLLSIIFVN